MEAAWIHLCINRRRSNSQVHALSRPPYSSFSLGCKLGGSPILLCVSLAWWPRLILWHHWIKNLTLSTYFSAVTLILNAAELHILKGTIWWLGSGLPGFWTRIVQMFYVDIVTREQISRTQARWCLYHYGGDVSPHPSHFALCRFSSH